MQRHDKHNSLPRQAATTLRRDCDRMVASPAQ